MAYVVARGSGWELRQSRRTGDGPRSRTLVTFRSLGTEELERAVERSAGRLDRDAVVAAARRAGAPVEPDVATSAGASLLTELAAGREPSPGVRRALLDALGVERAVLSPAERAASAWFGRDDAERGLALRDLLLLVDALPPPSRGLARRSRFPRLATGRRG